MFKEIVNVGQHTVLLLTETAMRALVLLKIRAKLPLAGFTVYYFFLPLALQRFNLKTKGRADG